MKKLLLAVLFLNCIFTACAQDSVTVRDYERAQRFLSSHVLPLVDNSSVNPVWIDDNRFWYTQNLNGVDHFFLVDGKRKARTLVVNPDKLLAALVSATGKELTSQQLAFTEVRFSGDMRMMYFRYENDYWEYDIRKNRLVHGQKTTMPTSETEERRFGFRRSQALSPDGTRTAFIRDHNLWIRETATKKEYPLTRDGEKNYGYATDNAGWKHSDNPVVQWSSDSRMIATFKLDERQVGDMYLVTTNVGHPELQSWKYPLPGDSNIAMVERVIIHVDEQQPSIVRLKMPADFHRATLGDDIAISDSTSDVQWSADNTKLAFVSTSRDHRQAKVRIADVNTGDVRNIFEENVATQFESGQSSISWRYLSSSDEFIWYSERDNYGHLYLYDASTGHLKNQITKGNYVVAAVKKVDERTRRIYFMAAGLDKKNPYFQHLCAISFDGSGWIDLTPEEGQHSVDFSPSGRYLINTFSQPDVPQQYNLRDISGNKIAELGGADVTRLEAGGWKPPITFSVKAADGVTDIYGLMFTPTGMETGIKYPLVDYIYPGPQGSSVRSWVFVPARGDHQALAELGFVVVLIEGTSNPMRTKSYHDMNYGNMAENTLPDQVAGIRQLAQRFDFIDTTRIGIWGHSGGGFATADAMFSYPDFFKVGISESGNHDNRNYEDDWGERYIGLLKKNPDGTSNYTNQANQLNARNLKGKLLLAHGMMDDNVPPYNTWLVVQALQDANKDFDLVIFPNSRHGYGRYTDYMMRRRWDYFVTNLKGALHPKEFIIKR